MIGVDEIEDIRKRARGGEPIASIARALGGRSRRAPKPNDMGNLVPLERGSRVHLACVRLPTVQTSLMQKLIDPISRNNFRQCTLAKQHEPILVQLGTRPDRAKKRQPTTCPAIPRLALAPLF